VIADVIDQLEPLDDGIIYRFPADVRHRYEWMELFPDGLIVTGDALCAFDPSFGQGMSVAAAEAMELRHELRLGRQHLARRFFAAAARHVDTPWTVVVGAGAAAAGIALEEPARARLIKRYVAAVRQAAADDPVVAGAFLRVAHLVDRPERLLAPRVAARVAAASLARRKAATSGVGFGHGVLHPRLIWPAIGPAPAPDHRGPVSSPRTGHLS
jgi:hypothetical protein